MKFALLRTAYTVAIKSGFGTLCLPFRRLYYHDSEPSKFFQEKVFTQDITIER